MDVDPILTLTDISSGCKVRKILAKDDDGRILWQSPPFKRYLEFSQWLLQQLAGTPTPELGTRFQYLIT